MGLSTCHCEPTYYSYPENKRFVPTESFRTVNGNICNGLYLPKTKLSVEEKKVMKLSGKKHICKVWIKQSK